MPKPKPGETKDDFMRRCTPMVMGDGTAEDNDQAVAACTNMWKESVQEANTKTVDGVEYPASAFLVVEDPEQPSTWHLRVKDKDGNNDHRLMGAAYAALTVGYRGNKYEGPNKADAMAKLKKIYSAEDMEVPSEKEAMSLNQKLMSIEDAARAKFQPNYSTIGPDMGFWVIDIFDEDGYIIAEAAHKHYRIAFEEKGDEYVFADPSEWEEVEEAPRQWVRKTEYFEAKVKPAKKDDKTFEGREWDITIIGPKTKADLITVEGKEYVRSLNGRLYSVDGLRESVPMWDGVKVYDNHLTDAEFQERAGMRSTKDEWLAVIRDPYWVESERKLNATLKVVDRAFASKAKDAYDVGELSTIGLSIDTQPNETSVVIEGTQMPAMTGFKKIFSVDVVAEPAAGGSFNRLIAANQIISRSEQMDPKELRKLVNRLLKEAFADRQIDDDKKEALETAIVNAAIAAKVEEAQAEEYVKPLVEAMIVQETVPADGGAGGGQGTDPDPDPEPEPEPTGAQESDAEKRLKALEHKIRSAECREARVAAIQEAKLPEAMAELVEGAYPDGAVWDIEKMQAFVKRTKEAQAKLDPSGRVTGVGGGNGGGVRVSHDQRDKMETEFLRLVAGNSMFRSFESQFEDEKQRFVKERIPESYQSYIKAGRPNYGMYSLREWVRTLLGGDPFADPRAYEAVTTSGMSSIVKNALNLILAADYAKRHRWWDPIVQTEEVDTIDQATLIRVYGLSTLSTVDEGQAYQELTWADEEETAAFVKKGNYVGVTLEALLRDKVNAIRSLPMRLSTSWYNTKSALAAAVFTVNTATGPALADTAALFNATAVSSAGGHANLLTTALSFTAFGAARTAMRKQTDQPLGAGQKLLIEPRFLLVPTDLETTANQIRNTERIPGSADNDMNPYYQKFEVVVVPAWTDTDNWALAGDPREYPAIWDINLRGNVAPTLFTADSEQGGAMFTNDTLRYKVRMLTFRFSSTYDCLPVSDFRPLHKSNV